MSDLINRVKYENGLPTATNGSWQQTIAYILGYMAENQITIDDISNATTASTSVIITDVSTLSRQTIVEVYDPFTLSNLSPTVYYTKVYYKPTPLIIKTPKSNLHLKCCGPYNPTNSEYVKCMNRVNECYQKVLECKGKVTQSDMTASTIKEPDCGCKEPEQKLNIKHTPPQQLPGDPSKWGKAVDTTKINKKC